MVNEELQGVFAQFDTASAAEEISPLGNGHINRTYLVRCVGGAKYVLQKINERVFTDVDLLMRNITRVTEYLNARQPGSSLSFIPARTGESYLNHNGDKYRLYEYVEGVCLEKAEKPEELGACGVAFGAFQRALSDFDASELGEVIPRFHDTLKRVEDLKAAAQADTRGRLLSVRDELAFYLDRQSEAGRMLEMQRGGLLKTRVTHNDTKLNNVILDSVTLQPKCVIDLDTVMPGLAGNDFGDCIRSGASTGAEDEQDLSKVNLDLAMYSAFAEGFLSRCGSALNESEIESLPWGAYLMTYECGARFLTDYLKGDVYFHTDYPEHNLVRARTQMKLVADTEKHWDKLNQIINDHHL